jgi:hypothetical protein
MAQVAGYLLEIELVRAAEGVDDAGLDATLRISARSRDCRRPAQKRRAAEKAPAFLRGSG